MPHLFDYCSEYHPTYYHYLMHCEFTLTRQNNVRWYAASDGSHYLIVKDRLFICYGSNRAAYYFKQLCEGDVSCIDQQDQNMAEVKALTAKVRLTPSEETALRKINWQAREALLKNQSRYFRK
jgi:hypothetical protein